MAPATMTRKKGVHGACAKKLLLKQPNSFRRNRSSPPAEGSGGKKGSGKKSKKVKEKVINEQAAVNDNVAEGIPAVPVILFMGALNFPRHQ